MRGKEPDSGGPRGATPQLTVAKHQLRDWIETQLRSLPRGGDEGGIERKLNSELRDAGLACRDDSTPGQELCPDWTNLGFVGNVRLRRDGVFLVVQTALGIECGYDESAYLYSWSDEGWRRVWLTEQNDYAEKKYKPQVISSVLISPYSRENDYVVLTLGTESWCSSNWHEVYYRAFRLGPDLQAAPLIEGAEFAFLGSAVPLRGSVTRSDVLVEFDGQSIDGEILVRSVVRHFAIDRDKVRRVAPLATIPRDFVDEWLTTEWSKAALWSESDNRRSTRDWHTKLHKDFVRGEFLDPTMHCPAKPDLWSVGVDFSDPPTPIGSEPKGTYFLVRWRPPYQFSLEEVSDHPWPECTEEDRRADEGRTLFPGR